MKKLLIAVVSGLIATLAVPAAQAQAAQPVELVGDVKVDKLVVENGKEKHVLIDPKVVVPGDKLIFSTAYHNKGAEAVSNFVVTNPLPAGVALAPQGADKLEVSVDGGKTWGRLAVLTVADATGQRPAQAGDVTHDRVCNADGTNGGSHASGTVSGTLASVAAGETKTLHFRATIN